MTHNFVHQLMVFIIIFLKLLTINSLTRLNKGKEKIQMELDSLPTTFSSSSTNFLLSLSFTLSCPSSSNYSSTIESVSMSESTHFMEFYSWSFMKEILNNFPSITSLNAKISLVEPMLIKYQECWWFISSFSW